MGGSCTTAARPLPSPSGALQGLCPLGQLPDGTGPMEHHQALSSSAAVKQHGGDVMASVYASSGSVAGSVRPHGPLSSVGSMLDSRTHLGGGSPMGSIAPQRLLTVPEQTAMATAGSAAMMTRQSTPLHPSASAASSPTATAMFGSRMSVPTVMGSFQQNPMATATPLGTQGSTILDSKNVMFSSNERLRAEASGLEVRSFGPPPMISVDAEPVNGGRGLFCGCC
mmetsp:Transcript_117782/g.293715  ORF Transcript_117782/g.293715 Transcript_117782/m.293715 type:complete len:225 (-) Transcript_117782:85-759(-)